MQIAVISDLHLGPGGATDAFGHDDGAFLRFLDHLEEHFQRVVLLGDIWETLTGRLPGGAARTLKAAREAHPEIARRFERRAYRYVHGNHDLVAGAVEGVPDELFLEADGVRLWFTHGHQGDPLVKHARWVSELGVWLGAMLKRFGLGFVQRFCDRLDQLRESFQLSGESGAFQQWAVASARARAVDVVITGHTHEPLREAHGAQLFLNSGSCSGGAFSFLAMDTRAGLYSVQSTW